MILYPFPDVGGILAIPERDAENSLGKHNAVEIGRRRVRNGRESQLSWWKNRDKVISTEELDLLSEFADLDIFGGQRVEPEHPR